MRGGGTRGRGVPARPFSARGRSVFAEEGRFPDALARLETRRAVVHPIPPSSFVLIRIPHFVFVSTTTPQKKKTLRRG